MSQNKKTYTKPVMVAKAEAKKSYVAGCPQNTFSSWGCVTERCEIVRAK